MIEYKRIAKEKRKKKRLLIAAIVLLIVVLMAVTYVLCNVKKVTVEGNENYSDEQIISLVLPSKWDYNTIYLFYKYHFTDVQQIPFLDLVEVEIVSHDEICIQVYEKKIVGYVLCDGSYVYFDKDGVVVEMSDQLREGLPVVNGLSFSSVELYAKLPVEEEAVFNTLVNLSQMLTKRELSPDQINFLEDQTIELLFGEVTVKLGEDENLDNKIARLAGIMPTLAGNSGILDMSRVNESTKSITFLKVPSQAEIQAAEEAAAEAARIAEEEAAEAARIAEEEARRQQEEWDREWAEENGEEYIPPDYSEDTTEEQSDETSEEADVDESGQ